MRVRVPPRAPRVFLCQQIADCVNQLKTGLGDQYHTRKEPEMIIATRDDANFDMVRRMTEPDQGVTTGHTERYFDFSFGDENYELLVQGQQGDRKVFLAEESDMGKNFTKHPFYTPAEVIVKVYTLKKESGFTETNLIAIGHSGFLYDFDHDEEYLRFCAIENRVASALAYHTLAKVFGQEAAGNIVAEGLNEQIMGLGNNFRPEEETVTSQEKVWDVVDMFLQLPHQEKLALAQELLGDLLKGNLVGMLMK